MVQGRCIQCLGTKRIRGMGMIYHNCPVCKGRGIIEITHYDKEDISSCIPACESPLPPASSIQSINIPVLSKKRGRKPKNFLVNAEISHDV